MIPEPSGWQRLPSWLRGLAILGGAAALLAWPFHRLFVNDGLARNEQAAQAALKRISGAQADFRGNDRDRNFIQDYWTRDVSGLFYVSVDGRPIQLIDPEIAAADALPALPRLQPAVPYHGYYFRALRLEDAARFAVRAYPAEPGVTGRYTFTIDEGNTIVQEPPLRK